MAIIWNPFTGQFDFTQPPASATTVTTIGTFDSGTPAANGASISGNNLLLQSASATVPGLVNTGTQTFAGTKTFNNTITASISGNAGTVTVADAGGDTTTFVLLATDATGSLAPVTDAGLTYNATTNALTTTTFIGALTGNADTATSATTAITVSTTVASGAVGTTQTYGDNSTKIATTAYADTASTPRNTSIGALDIDWSLGEVFYKSISAGSTFTFSNTSNGKTIIVVITADGTNRQTTFPTAIKPTSWSGLVTANTTSVFTFVRSNGTIYASEVNGMV